MTRRQVVLRALAAGIVAGLLVGGFMVWRQRSAPPPPAYPITLPESVAWANRSVTRMPDGSERSLVEAFVGDGKKFRLEVRISSRPPIVWVYDGQSLAVSARVPDRSAADLDPRNTILSAYETFPGFRFLGIKRIGRHDCWIFEQQTAGIRSRFCVDARTCVPRQVIIEYPDGRRDTQTYVDLPAHRSHQPGLFDKSRLDPMLVASAEAMLAR